METETSTSPFVDFDELGIPEEQESPEKSQKPTPTTTLVELDFFEKIRQSSVYTWLYRSFNKQEGVKKPKVKNVIDEDTDVVHEKGLKKNFCQKRDQIRAFVEGTDVCLYEEEGQEMETSLDA